MKLKYPAQSLFIWDHPPFAFMPSFNLPLIISDCNERYRTMLVSYRLTCLIKHAAPPAATPHVYAFYAAFQLESDLYEMVYGHRRRSGTTNAKIQHSP